MQKKFPKKHLRPLALRRKFGQSDSSTQALTPRTQVESVKGTSSDVLDNADRLRRWCSKLTAQVQKAIDSKASTQVRLTIDLANGEIRRAAVNCEEFERF